jgi:hypothetical protein
MCHYNADIWFKSGCCAHGKRAVESDPSCRVEFHGFAKSVFSNYQVLQWQLDPKNWIVYRSGRFSGFINVGNPSFFPVPAGAARNPVGACAQPYDFTPGYRSAACEFQGQSKGLGGIVSSDKCKQLIGGRYSDGCYQCHDSQRDNHFQQSKPDSVSRHVVLRATIDTCAL